MTIKIFGTVPDCDILINRKDMFGSQHYNHESFKPLDINHRVTYHYCKYDDFKYLDSLE